jgi:hypothetical protein
MNDSTLMARSLGAIRFAIDIVNVGAGFAYKHGEGSNPKASKRAIAPKATKKSSKQLRQGKKCR